MKSITNRQSSERILGAAILPFMETMEARQLLSAPHAVVAAPTVNADAAVMVVPLNTKSAVTTTKAGEYHGVLTISALPGGIIPGVGGTTKQPSSFQTQVILTIQPARNGGVTGVLNARQLGTFAVTGSIRNGQLLLKFVPTGRSGSTKVASFRGMNSGVNHLTGTFLEDVAGQSLHGRLRLNFIKQTDLQPSPSDSDIPAIGTSATGIATSVSTGMISTGTGTNIDAASTTPAVDTTVDTALGGINFGAGTDFSGTNIGIGTGLSSIDQSIGININAPLLGATGSPDISGTNTGFDSGGIAPNMVP